jgi:hypothetical protein
MSVENPNYIESMEKNSAILSFKKNLIDFSGIILNLDSQKGRISKEDYLSLLAFMKDINKKKENNFSSFLFNRRALMSILNFLNSDNQLEIISEKDFNDYINYEKDKAPISKDYILYSYLSLNTNNIYQEFINESTLIESLFKTLGIYWKDNLFYYEDYYNFVANGYFFEDGLNIFFNNYFVNNFKNIPFFKNNLILKKFTTINQVLFFEKYLNNLIFKFIFLGVLTKNITNKDIKLSVFQIIDAMVDIYKQEYSSYNSSFKNTLNEQKQFMKKLIEKQNEISLGHFSEEEKKFLNIISLKDLEPSFLISNKFKESFLYIHQISNLKFKDITSIYSKKIMYYENTSPIEEKIDNFLFYFERKTTALFSLIFNDDNKNSAYDFKNSEERDYMILSLCEEIINKMKEELSCEDNMTNLNSLILNTKNNNDMFLTLNYLIQNLNLFLHFYKNNFINNIDIQRNLNTVSEIFNKYKQETLDKNLEKMVRQNIAYNLKRIFDKYESVNNLFTIPELKKSFKTNLDKSMRSPATHKDALDLINIFYFKTPKILNFSEFCHVFLKHIFKEKYSKMFNESMEAIEQIKMNHNKDSIQFKDINKYSVFSSGKYLENFRDFLDNTDIINNFIFNYLNESGDAQELKNYAKTQEDNDQNNFINNNLKNISFTSIQIIRSASEKSLMPEVNIMRDLLKKMETLYCYNFLLLAKLDNNLNKNIKNLTKYNNKKFLKDGEIYVKAYNEKFHINGDYFIERFNELLCSNEDLLSLRSSYEVQISYCTGSEYEGTSYKQHVMSDNTLKEVVYTITDVLKEENLKDSENTAVFSRFKNISWTK